MKQVTHDWFDITRHCTVELARVRSVSPGDGENGAARTVLRLLAEGGFGQAYTEIGLDLIHGDPWGRQNAFAFLRGRSARTLVLLGHIDTVDTADYGSLEPWALDPDALNERLDQFASAPGAAEDVQQSPGDWMFGRGVADMKSGVAANIAVMRRLAAERERELSVVMLATPDEENESAGVLRAVRFLHELRQRYGLEYAGAVNTDYTSALYPGDPHRYIYNGTVGKLLAGFFVVGSAAHAGEPFAGEDVNLLTAELIRDLSMNIELCDAVRDSITPPPVTLRAGDLKSHYDTQLPFMAYFLLNILTLGAGPGEFLDRLLAQASTSFGRLAAQTARSKERWLQRQPAMPDHSFTSTRRAAVLTYADLHARSVERMGAARVAAELDDEWGRWPVDLDKRERCVHLIARLWPLSGLNGPAAVLFYAPPYYPHVAATPSALHRAVDEVIAAHPELDLAQREFFPLMSDMSYLQLDPGIEVADLIRNMPVWEDPEGPMRPGAYSLPFSLIRDLDLPVVNIGPYGRAAHQRGERVLMSYSFGSVPQLIYETIERLDRA